MDNGDGKRVDHSRASQAPASHPAIGSSVTNPSQMQQLATPGADAGSGAVGSWHLPLTGHWAVGSWQVHATVARPAMIIFLLHVAAQAPPTIAKYASHHPKFLMLLPPSPNAPPTIAKGSSHHCKGLLPPSLQCPSSLGSLVAAWHGGSLQSIDSHGGPALEKDAPQNLISGFSAEITVRTQVD
ncbi:hypothetical protein E4U30_008033 [Claviceps sp. LM220 group G6]|nr:hypothetical protein E4U30_008033 [Claviceps sp. LM220 group G6]